MALTPTSTSGSEPRCAFPLVLFQPALLLLGVGLIALASESTIAPEFRRAVPLLCTVMVLWCVFQLGALGLFVRTRTRGKRFSSLRVSIDLTFSLAIVWLTGGVVSFFLPLLFASVIASCTTMTRRLALCMAAVVTSSLTLMTLSQVLGWRPAEWTGAVQLGVEGRVLFLIASLIGHGIALHLVAFLATQLRTGRDRAVWLSDQIVASVAHGIIALDAKGRVVQMNGAALELFGYPRDTAWRGLYPDAIFRRDEDAPLRRVLADPTPGAARADWSRRDGEEIPVSIFTSIVDDGANGDRLSILVLQDLSLELRAARAEERLRHLEALEDLALGLVHEIRNPLASIRGCVQELGKGTLPDDQAARLSGIVIRESDRLDRIVDEFLECSSASPTRVERVDLQELMADAVDSLRGRDDASGILWDPSDDESVVVWGHRELLYRVILNLGVNAVEATPDGGEIRFGLFQRDGGWVVEVSDQGCGMDEATRKRIFTPFFTTKNREGGLGLALVERIVQGHGGSIEVESTTGEGTRFCVWIPIGTPATELGTTERLESVPQTV